MCLHAYVFTCLCVLHVYMHTYRVSEVNRLYATKQGLRMGK